mmetsp:Transcript_16752/g.27228  ORF Transcript_16752/g.27228 Transcript_16752/m.27228 type:complete len:160 (-) Transcript_16752:108-587(-)
MPNWRLPSENQETKGRTYWEGEKHPEHLEPSITCPFNHHHSLWTQKRRQLRQASSNSKETEKEEPPRCLLAKCPRRAVPADHLAFVLQYRPSNAGPDRRGFSETFLVSHKVVGGFLDRTGPHSHPPPPLREESALFDDRDNGSSPGQPRQHHEAQCQVP